MFKSISFAVALASACLSGSVALADSRAGSRADSSANSGSETLIGPGPVHYIRESAIQQCQDEFFSSYELPGQPGSARGSDPRIAKYRDCLLAKKQSLIAEFGQARVDRCQSSFYGIHFSLSGYVEKFDTVLNLPGGFPGETYYAVADNATAICNDPPAPLDPSTGRTLDLPYNAHAFCSRRYSLGALGPGIADIPMFLIPKLDQCLFDFADGRVD